MADLLPQRSLVRNLLAMGVDVFVIDWGSATPEDRHHDLDHYAIDHLGGCIDAGVDAATREGSLPRYDPAMRFLPLQVAQRRTPTDRRWSYIAGITRL